MPREIIDTRRSRPTYVRRLLITAVAVVVALALLGLVVWMFQGNLAR